MDSLSALAIAQGAIPPTGQEAIQKAILQADLDRTRHEYERSRTLAEDNHHKCMRCFTQDVVGDQNVIIGDLQNAVWNQTKALDEVKQEVEYLEAEIALEEQESVHLWHKKHIWKQK